MLPTHKKILTPDPASGPVTPFPDPLAHTATGVGGPELNWTTPLCSQPPSFHQGCDERKGQKAQQYWISGVYHSAPDLCISGSYCLATIKWCDFFGHFSHFESSGTGASCLH